MAREPRPLFCAYCSARTKPGEQLCEKHKIALTPEYMGSNSAIVDAYTKRGLAQMEQSLEAHAAFERWLEDHEGGP